MIAEQIAHGHILLADWLFLLAVVFFALATVFAALQRPDPSHGSFVPAGLCLVALAWLLL